MLNTHRLVLKGHRVPYTAEMDQQIKDTDRNIMLQQGLILAGCVLLFGFLLYVLFKTIHAAILRKKRFDLSFYCVSDTVFLRLEHHLQGSNLGCMTKKVRKIFCGHKSRMLLQAMRPVKFHSLIYQGLYTV